MSCAVLYIPRCLLLCSGMRPPPLPPCSTLSTCYPTASSSTVHAVDEHREKDPEHPRVQNGAAGSNMRRAQSSLE